jgi:hypothetical protein
MHPYKNFPTNSFWDSSVAKRGWESVFNEFSPKFEIKPNDKISSAGSCFAQRVKKSLIENRLNYTFFEKPHDFHKLYSDRDFGYDTFSCRYGNIYNSVQLQQLVDECLGYRDPIIKFGKNKKNRYVDLCRPNACPDYFSTIEDLIVDRIYHLHKVKEMFADIDVFIFTLGLTECWREQASGIIYGSHPDIFTADSNSGFIEPVNLDCNEVLTSLEYSFDKIKSTNPNIKIILTVSPVGLTATHQDKNVLFASSYSKSVLRSVAGKLADSNDHIEYFPSFEFFGMAQSFGQYLAEDLRDVNQRDVSFIMKCFINNFFEGDKVLNSSVESKPFILPSSSVAELECEEVLNSIDQIQK